MATVYATSNSRTTGAKTNCIPDGLYPSYWDDPAVKFTDSKGQQATGMGIGVNDLAMLCNCVRETKLPGTRQDGSAYVPTPTGSQARIDECWSWFYSYPQPGGIVNGDRMAYGKPVPIYKVPWSELPGFPGPGTVLNFPDPCKAPPARCSATTHFEGDYYGRRGQNKVLWVEREPFARPTHPVDSEISDPARLRLLASGDAKPGEEELTPTWGSPNIPYLKSLKAQRESTRLQYPLLGVNTLYSSGISLPKDILAKQNMIVAGTVVTAIGLGALVYVLTKKK